MVIHSCRREHVLKGLLEGWKESLSYVYTHMQMPTHSSKQSAYSAMEMSILLILRKKQQRVGMPLSEENLKHNISESVALRK